MSSPISVLHVDDDPDFRDLAAIFLEREEDRFTVETAATADKGLSSVSDRAPDCIVSDFNMPGMDGIEFLQAVREEHPDLPFILFTGKGSESVASDAIAAGVTDYLQKKSGTEQYKLLANRITNAVQAQRATQEAARHRGLTRLTQFLGDTGGWELDLRTEELMLTDGTRRLIGLSPDDSLGLEEAIDLYHPDDRDDLRAALDRAAETGNQVQGTYRIQPQEGAQRLLDVTVTPVRSNGEVTALRGAVNDVTDQKTRERQLTELNETAQRLSRARSRQEIAEIGTEAAREVLGLRVNAIHFATEDGAELVPAAQTEESVSLIGDAPILPVEGSIAGRVYRDSEPTAIENVRQDLDAYDLDTNLRGHLYLPLDDYGVLIAGSEEAAAFDDTDITVGELLAGNLVAALNRVDRTETAQQRQEQLSLSFEQSPFGAIQWDEQFGFNRLNERAQELLGYSEAELRGESWERIVADGDHDQAENVVEQLLEANGGTYAVNENITRNGEVRTCEWYNRAVTGLDGEVRSIFSKLHDVTERERHKQQLEEYETVLKTLSDAMYVVDEDGRFTYVNDEFVELVGYGRETIIRNTPSLIKDEDAVETAKRQLGRLLSDEGPDNITFEVTIHPRDGDPRVCEDHIRVLPYEGDTFDGSVGTLRDVTERKEHIRELERQNDRLEEFTSVVSHDLRNPL